MKRNIRKKDNPTDKESTSPYNKNQLIGGIIGSLVLIILGPFVAIFMDLSWLAFAFLICGFLLLMATILMPLIVGIRGGFAESKKQHTVIQEQASYPVVKKLNPKALFGVLGLALFTYLCYDRWAFTLNSYNTKFFDRRTGEIFSNMSSGDVTLSLILLIATALMLIIALLHLFQKVYQLSCPICGGNIEIPVGTRACDCPLCKKRLIYKNGAFLSAKEITRKMDGGEI